MTIEYRAPKYPEELPLVGRLFMAMLEELAQYGHDILPTDWNKHAMCTGVFAHALYDNVHGIVLAFDGETPIGAVIMTPEATQGLDGPPGRVIDWGCYVSPPQRRQGVATTLRTKAITLLRAHNFKTVISRVKVTNKAGLDSYRKVGAKITGYEMEITI